MQVTMMKQTIQFENERLVGEKITAYIIDKVKESNVHFAYMVIDQIEVYDDFEEYIGNNYKNIKHVEVVVYTAKELVNELLLSVEDYIRRAHPEIKKLIDQFYQGATESTWSSFEQFIAAIQWLLETLMSIENSSSKPKSWSTFAEIKVRLEQESLGLEEALANNDSVLIADIIQYELLPLFEELLQVAGRAIDEEGHRHHVN